ncbi:MAG TPA: M28 family peptidase, partial [Leptospiraceae bacterium]|nr:M28 family peptidase [Leptospiraceae bacterium]
MRQTLLALSLLIFTSLFLYARASANVLPVVSEDSRETEFSALRAMAHLKNIAQSPRPLGSAENRRVREYLIRTLQGLGVDVRIVRGSAVRTLIPRVHAAGNVYNVLAVIPGRKQEALLFLTHYDSVPTGPGAADNGASVVSA